MLLEQKRKTKIWYYENLNENKFLDDKQFWKVLKGIFSDQSFSGDKTNLKMMNWSKLKLKQQKF